jgi:very-short-patch-repair endonuclease
VRVKVSPSVVTSTAIQKARCLRKDMTLGEQKLWRDLKDFCRLYGIHVRRQAPIGAYIADFAIHEHKLIIEVDGHFHIEGEGPIRDAKRDAWFAGVGYRVHRISTGNLETAFEGCIEDILRELGLMGVNGAYPHP